MAATTSTAAAPAPRRRHGWLKALAWVFIILVVLLIILYFVGTSSAFFKSVILPKVSKALNAEVTVSDASISPFKHVILHNLKVQTTGPEPLVSAPEVRLRYSLMDIIRGNILVDEVALVSPTVVLIQNPDGTSNLDPILKAQKAKPEEQKPQPPAQPSKPSKPAQVDIKTVALTDGTVRQVKLYQNGNRDTTEVSHINVTVNNVRNGQTGKLTLGSDIRVDNNPPAPGTPGQLQANVNGNFSFALTADLKPASIQGNTKLAVSRAQGALAQLADFGALFDCNVTPTDIKQVALHLQKGQTGLGDIRASGPFDMEKTEGRIAVEVVNIDKNLLNLAGASSGLDFGPTTINSTNEIQLAKAGSQISAAGQLNLNQFQITRTNQTTPPLDLRANYAATVDRAASNAVLKVFTLNGTQKGNSLLHGELTRPMPLSWGGNTEAFGESALDLALTHLNLADWRALAGDNSLAGDVNVNVRLLSQQGGKQSTLNLESQINNVSAATNNVQVARLVLKGNLKDTTPDFKRHDAAGTFALSDFTGQFGSTKLQNFGTTVDLDLGMTPQQVQIRKLDGKLTEGQAVGGNFGLSGTYDLTNKTAQFKATLANFNQALLGVFLQPMLGDKKLTSIAINGNADIQHNPQAASVVKANLQVTNLVVSDPAGQFPAKPLEAKLVADVSLDNPKQVAELRQILLGLTPTARATNQIQLTGRVDMSHTNAIQGNLKLAADSLDFTSYYDLFAGQKPSAAASATPPGTTAPKAQAAAAPAGPEKEPPAMSLPLSNFVAEASFGPIYLHEVEITNFLATVNLNGGKVLVKPFQLAINGAPVNSTVNLDLGVPGYKYDVSFNAQAIPLAPFVNSFQPERKGQLSGTFTAQAGVTGAGITGASLQKNLAGQFDMGSTNLNLQVVNIKNRVLKLLVNVVSRIPELIRNPGGTATSLVAGFLGGAGPTGGLASDLQKSPINTIAARGVIGSGKVEFQQALVQSPVFQVLASGGTVTLATVLSNSTLNIPVTIALERSVAQKINLVPANTPTNAAYVKLPDFLTVAGTVGDPKEKINPRALLGLAAQGLSGVGGQAGGIMQGLSGFLNKPSTGTNAPAATNPPGGGVGGFLRGFLGTPAATNAPSATATNQPPATNQSPMNNLLNRFLK